MSGEKKQRLKKNLNPLDETLGKLAVERTDKDQGVGSSAGVESGMEQLTEWYHQTNEMAEATDGGVSASDGTGEEDTTAKKS